jgi:hypothetical protein
MKIFLITTFILFFSKALLAQSSSITTHLETSVVAETTVQEIKLAAPLNLDQAELSGLTWCGDRLILLPQYPRRISNDKKSYFYYLEKTDIVRALKDTRTKPLKAKPILVNEKDLRKAVSIFDGFEAIECQNNKVWLSIEAVTFLGEYQSFVVPAEIRFEPTASMTIDQERLTHLPSLSKMRNMGDEAIVMVGDDVIAIHEINDARVVSSTKARRIQRHDSTISNLAFPSLPFRITDATKLDENNRFWAINYKYSGDKFSRNATDTIAEQYGQGSSHKKFYNVERLLEFELTKSGISTIPAAPIQLRMEQVEGRNWEGLVRLDNLGFLLVSDKHPKTILGFVPRN